MSLVIAGSVSGQGAEVETYSKAIRVANVPREAGYSVAGVTGTLAAALAANSQVFSMFFSSGAGTTRAWFQRIRLQWTTIVAFTTAVTAGRRLELYRGSGASTFGGSAIATAAPKSTALGTSFFSAAQGGDIRIATTASLTAGGITFEATAVGEMTLTHVGAAGGFYETLFDFSAPTNHPLVLSAGQILAVRVPQAMDAAGTWQLGATADWLEGAAL